MIKLIIFDLDGVLTETRELHYQALNKALESIDKKYIINREEHLSTYDGLSTSKKLNLLHINKGLDPSLFNQIWRSKQQATFHIIDTFEYDNEKRRILQKLKSEGYILAVASNSIRHTVKMMLLRLGLMEYIDKIYSNEDVVHPKPHPEIYMRCMLDFHISPKETLIIEDSHIGRKSAFESGAHILGVINSNDLTLEKILRKIDYFSGEHFPKWQGGNMNILIPMAGAGKRFQQAGYTFPKPLIDVLGKPMIQWIVENINIDGHYTYVVQKEHFEKYNLYHLLNLLTPKCNIVQVDGVTEGAACTTLLAKEFINSSSSLLIANSDQYVEWNSNEFLYAMEADEIDGGILTFQNTHPKWSYVRLDDRGFVTELAEKKPISNIATVGIYYYKHGLEYVRYAEQMINQDIRVNGEFYVAPVYNEYLKDNKKIRIFNIDKMWGLGTPEDLIEFTKGFNK